MPNANIAFIAAGELEKDRFAELWTAINFVSSDPPISGVPGAYGRVYDTSIWPTARIQFDDASLVTVKTRLRFVNSVDGETFMELQDGAASTQLSLVYRSTGAIDVKRSGVLLGSGGSISLATHYELEWRTRISNGAGMVAVNIDGNQIICVPSGADTDESGSGVVNRWAIGNSSLALQFDDCVVDRAGTYLGVGRVETLMPNGIGDLSQLTPNSAAANYTLVSEKPHDAATSYVSSTGDQIDTYQFENISLGGTPLGVMLSAQALHATGAPTMKLVCRIDGENYESTTIFTPGNSYRQMAFYPFPVNPATGDPWTADEINAAQWGVHCLATGIDITQVALQVYLKTADSDQCLAAGNRNYCGTVNEDLN